MPDIAMCDSASCPARAKCHRNAASGTQPDQYRQSYLILADADQSPDRCGHYWPVHKKGASDD